MPKKSKTVELSDEEIIAQFAALLTRLATQEIPDDDEADDDEDVEEVDDDDEDDEEEDEEEADEEEDDEDALWDEDSLAELDRADLKALADEYEIEYTAKTAGKTLITKILEAQDAELESTADDDEDDDDDDDESEFWTEKELKGKPLAELRTIAKEYDLPVKGKSEKELIKAIVNA